MSSSDNANTQEALSIDPSPFGSRLGTNYAATAEEVKQIQAMIKDPLRKLKELEEEEKVILNDLESNHEKQWIIDTFMTDLRALISPIRCLPPKILGEIFYQCLDSPNNPIMSARTAPILLTWVCSRWRDVAFGTPRLWAAIHIPVPNLPYLGSMSVGPNDELPSIASDLTDKRVRGIEEWLGRSGTCALDISVSEGVPPSQMESDFGARIMHAILPYSERWKKISLTGRVATVTELLNLPSSSFPSLQALLVDGDQDGATHVYSEALRTSGIIHAPNLQEVALPIELQNVAKYPLKWGQLTHLTIEGSDTLNNSHLSIPSFVTFLGSCQSLLSLKLALNSLINFTISDAPEAPICHLPLVERLTVSESSPYSSPIFDFFDFPVLKDLEYHPGTRWGIIRPEDPGTPLSFLTFLSRTTAKIQRLIIGLGLFRETELIPCLRECSSLKSLILVGNTKTFINNEFLLHFLTPLCPNTYLCPDLEVFICHSLVTFSDDALYQFIQGKQEGGLPGVSKLRKVVVWFQRSSSENLVPKLAPYTEEGLLVDIRYRSRADFSAASGLKGRDIWQDFDNPDPNPDSDLLMFFI